MVTNRQLINGYAQMVEDRERAGWKAYLLTFMFEEIGGSPRRVQEIMHNEVERVYATMLTRIVRHPRSQWHAWKLPLLIACPDWPVPKHDRQHKQRVLPNIGQHFHAVQVMPPVSRMREPLDEHIEDEQARYVRKPLLRIHAARITHNAAYVARYTMKALERGRVGADAVLVLPTSAKDMTSDGITSWTRRRIEDANGNTPLH